MPDICVRLGRRISALRSERGMTQEILSSRIGLARANLSRIENGRAEPGIRTLRAIAKELKIALAELFKGLD